MPKNNALVPLLKLSGASAKLLLYSRPVISCHFLHLHKVIQFGILDLCPDICLFLEQENFGPSLLKAN